MKLLIAALTVAFSSVALAYPAVGDKAVFVGTYNEQGVDHALEISVAIVEPDAAKAGSWIHAETVKIDGQVVKSEKSSGEGVTPEQIKELLTNCSAFGGVSETITVPAGTFPTCKFTGQAETELQVTWFADVPFGIAKMSTVTEEADTMVAELQSYEMGQ